MIYDLKWSEDQSVTFWCRYWSRDRNWDHFGLEYGLETSLVTLGSVTFWSQNGLETGLRPFWSQKWSRDLVSSLSASPTPSSSPSSLLPPTTPPGTVWLTKAWNSCARPTLLSSASTSLIGWSCLSYSSSEALLLPFKDQRHPSFWWSSITRSPRNFDAVLCLYRTNKLHLAAGVCVQVSW